MKVALICLGTLLCDAITLEQNWAQLIYTFIYEIYLQSSIIHEGKTGGNLQMLFYLSDAKEDTFLDNFTAQFEPG